MQTPTHPRYVRRDDPLLFERYRLTPRQVRRAQSEGRLRTHKPSGPTGPAYVDTRQVRALFIGQGDLLTGLDHAALCALAVRLDALLWGEL